MVKEMQFIDLFAGLGGFHVAASALPIPTQCVFASEKNKTLRTLYTQKFGVRPCGDIRGINVDNIPDFDILFAGFPCQPFTSIGKRAGFADANTGNLFFSIEAILRAKHPQFFLLEQVHGILGVRMQAELRYILSVFNTLRYDVIYYVLSPHQFGIPQHRKRVFFFGSRERIRHELMPVHDVRNPTLPAHSITIRDIMLDRAELSDEITCRFMPVTEPRLHGQIERYRVKHGITDGARFVFQSTHNEDKFGRSIGIDRGVGHRGTTRTLIGARASWPIHLQEPYRIFTPREGARLQSLPDALILPDTYYHAYNAVGNAINALVAQRVLEFHLCGMLDEASATAPLRIC